MQLRQFNYCFFVCFNGFRIIIVVNTDNGTKSPLLLIQAFTMGGIFKSIDLNRYIRHGLYQSEFIWE